MKCAVLIACWIFFGTTLIDSYRFATTAAFAPSSVTFDGADDRIAFTGSSVTFSAGTQVTIAFWVNLDNTAAHRYVIQGRDAAGGAQWRVSCNITGITILAQNATPATVLSLDSDNNLVAGGWHHVMMSIDMASTSTRHTYIDGVEASNNVNVYTVGATLALDRNTLYVGADDSLGAEMAGCLAELWIDDTYIDFSNATNRAKFFNAGDPVDLGTNGSTPTGSAPSVYMKFVAGSLAVNSGAGAATGTVSGGVTTGDCGAVGN